MKIVSLTTFVSFQGQSFISANGQIGVYGELGRTTRGVRQECSLQADDVSGEKTYPLQSQAMYDIDAIGNLSLTMCHINTFI